MLFVSRRRPPLTPLPGVEPCWDEPARSSFLPPPASPLWVCCTAMAWHACFSYRHDLVAFLFWWFYMWRHVFKMHVQWLYGSYAAPGVGRSRPGQISLVFKCVISALFVSRCPVHHSLVTIHLSLQSWFVASLKTKQKTTTKIPL